MKTKTTYLLILAAGLLAAFVLWTWAVTAVDVRPIGPQASQVGFAALNAWVYSRIGVHLSLYTVTDWLGLVPVATAMGFALLGLCQWIRRGSPFRVDCDILVLGVFYITVISAYLLFEALAVNCRPILIDGRLEASYPSSTTLLVLCVMPTAAMQLHARIRNQTVKRCVTSAIIAFTAFMVIGRLISGVHWITDIIGGALLSAGLVLFYAAVCSMLDAEK